MASFQNILNPKSPYSFFVKFLGLFLVLYLIFPLYWGVVGEGGIFHSPFIAKHFNLIQGLSSFLTKAAQLFLNVFGYETFQKQPNALRIGSSRGIIVGATCSGWGVMSFWVAFIIANKGTVSYKSKWITTGLLAIIFLNITRISLIALANHLKWSTITSLDHHQAFNIASYCCIFILIYLYIKAQKKYEQSNNDARTRDSQLSTIR